ncbi:MAG: LexA family protein [Planctomycetota bacterium]
MTNLSPRQQAILDHITDQQAAGLTPSMREIGNAVGLKSSSSIRAQLGNLEAMGYIRIAAGKARSIVVVGAQATGWISVKDRLPPEQRWVLVYKSFNRPHAMINRPYSIAMRYSGEWHTASYLLSPNCKVTHWQPLPDGPEE